MQAFLKGQLDGQCGSYIYHVSWKQVYNNKRLLEMHIFLKRQADMKTKKKSYVGCQGIMFNNGLK